MSSDYRAHRNIRCHLKRLILNLGLKKVTADMQTHKNPTLRSNADKPIPGKKPTGLGKPASVNAPPVTKPPKFELDGKKWIVEYFKNNPNIEIEQTETNQSVYVFRCEGSTIKVGGKCNNIILDGCKKTAIVFDNVVSSCEFINCQSVQMQVSAREGNLSESWKRTWIEVECFGNPGI